MLAALLPFYSYQFQQGLSKHTSPWQQTITHSPDVPTSRRQPKPLLGEAASACRFGVVAWAFWLTGFDESGERAAASTNRVKRLRASFFSMVFSFVVCSLESVRLRGRDERGNANDTPAGTGCQRCGLKEKERRRWTPLFSEG
jgi:hypothetical protein